MNIGLYFGTFNPVHTGHLIIANHMVEHSDLDEVWMVITPHSPFKKKATLLDNYQRYEMVYRATVDLPLIRPSAIEFDLPKPSYTINTLVSAEEKYPNDQFSLIMGEDNLQNLHKWKNYTEILNNYNIYVYPRVLKKQCKHTVVSENIYRIEAPIVEISSTDIRKLIKSNKNVQPLLPKNVWEYIEEMNFYKK